MKARRSARGRRRWLTVLPAIVLALLPRLACPCQMPAYAGLLGSAGLAFLMSTVYLFPLTASCLTVAVGGLAVGARRRQGYAPFWVGASAAMLLMFGKFVIDWDPAVYSGIALLVAASLWNSWPSKKRAKLQFTSDGHVRQTTSTAK